MPLQDKLGRLPFLDGVVEVQDGLQLGVGENADGAIRGRKKDLLSAPAEGHLVDVDWELVSGKHCWFGWRYLEDFASLQCPRSRG